MKIGYACISLLSEHSSTKKFILSRLKEDILYEYIYNNLNGLLGMLEYNKKKGIEIFRITSDLIPFLSHEKNTYKWNIVFKEKFIEIGNYIKENNMRVTMHPGQYTVINSGNDEIAKKSLHDIEKHAEILELMELDYSNKITIHAGGAYGDKEKSLQRFTQKYKQLSDSARYRLIIENDDKIYNTDDLKKIFTVIDIPVVFDNLHNICNPSYLKQKEILDEIKQTWKKKDGNMLLHYSETENPKKCSHTYNISGEKFDRFLNSVERFDPDIIIEAKGKDIAAIKGNNILREKNKTLKRIHIEHEWAAYKYAVMERGYNYYKEISESLADEKSIISFYSNIEKILKKKKETGSVRNAFGHVKGYCRDFLSERQEKYLEKLTEENKYDNAKKYLRKIVYENDIRYLKDSYYWYY